MRLSKRPARVWTWQPPLLFEWMVDFLLAGPCLFLPSPPPPLRVRKSHLLPGQVLSFAGIEIPRFQGGDPPASLCASDLFYIMQR